MTKLSAIIAFVAAAAVTLDNIEAANLRQNESGRYLATMKASASGSTEFLFDESDASDSAADDRFLAEEETSTEGSSSVDGSEGNIATFDMSVNGSDDRFLMEVEASLDTSNVEDLVDESEDGSGLRMLVEVESSVDGSTVVDSLEASEEVDDQSSDNVAASKDTNGVESPYQPGTVKPAPTDDSTWASREFDKSDLTWWK
ncbi:hypothetical protein PHYPSEUDO_007173 [Phytophthora pseudosyringae]|uniref:RxLR effector protein n=1 Tax=Phytophthora pseudosyringae TaxID=221518 RepID=A0A8T1VHA8_9STRA|nr:hypothetical protein PHYPSEUDO_007173 [Phytophthora pseudosyringae]